MLLIMINRLLSITQQWYNSNADVVKVLIEKGADVNALNNDKSTPLHWAASNNSNADVVKVLIEKGADVNALNNDKSTPLHQAAFTGRT